MDSRLLVPATPALLDGWCGPVVAHVYTHPEPCVLVGPVVVGLEGDGAEVVHYALHVVEGETFETAPAKDIALDLSRAECRSRVALLLAPLMGLGRVDSACGMPGRTWYLSHGLAWSEAIEGNGWRRYPDSCDKALAGIPVEGDDTRLADGSRWVDVAALAAVAREVLCG